MVKRRYVIDTSVAVKWFVQEVYSEAALRVPHHPDYSLQVPEFFLLEFGNVVGKKRRRGEITPEVRDLMMTEVQNVPWVWHPDKMLFAKAFDLADETGRSLYDCLYLSLALAIDGQMVTADRKFYEALQTSPYANRLLWVEDIP
jgi:predicted nucleic acid-binding protein